MNQTLFTSSLPWDAEHSPALVIYCSDNRFGHQTEEFLQTHLGIPRVDRFIVPGGGAWLVLREGTMQEYDAARESLKMLVEHHGISRIVLVAHQDCGFYQVQMPHLGDAERCATQKADLQEAARILSGWFAGIRVEAYYAHVVDAQVGFESVATCPSEN